MENLLTPMAQIALIMGLAEVCKRLGIKNKYIPLIDLALGLVSGICVYGLAMGQDMTESIVLGIALGLSACGLFSGVKNVTQERVDEIEYMEES